jgi:hypothetical protein
MTKGLKLRIIFAALLGMASLSAVTYHQFVEERAAIKNATSFYACCGLSKLEVLKTAAIERILVKKPGSPPPSYEGLTRAWYMAASMPKVDTQRAESTALFRDFGAKVDVLMAAEQVTRDDVVAISRELSKKIGNNAYRPALTDVQVHQLERLEKHSAVLSAMASETLLKFETLAQRLGYTGTPAHLRGVPPYVGRPLGRLALCLVEPSVLAISAKDSGLFYCLKKL